MRATNQAVFFTAVSCHKPKDYEEAGATARLFTRLDYLLCASRFAHYLCCMVRDAPGTARTPALLEAYLNEWISQYVLVDKSADIYAKARRPLSQARIQITELPGKPGAQTAVFYFHPHFQIEDPPVGYRIVTSLPQFLAAH
ncbi:MAG: hypothetical protein WDO73_09930 [Ignavibacteriota bacterium]